MNKLNKRITLSMHFGISIFIINLITTIITGFLMYLSFSLGILNENTIENVMVLPIMTLIASIIIGVIVSACSSRIVLKNVREFITATDKLSKGDFSARLNIKRPPEFKVLSKNFNKMAEELGGIEVLRTDFINNFSHEFKTPIISIKGFAEILKDDELPKEEKNEYLDIIIEESKRLTSLATNVLNLSKIETQVILKDIQRFNMGEQIRQSILLLDSKFESKNILLDVNIQDCYINGNKEMLNQVWVNLLDNAIKFNNKNGMVSINMKREEDNILITIIDTGVGINKEAINKIFDKFYQEDTSHATNGNGLGLSIVKKIIELHGGTIQCDSIVSKGTKFTVTIPLN
ncbi:HAMP domain-containing sensor histidine kinase [Clostridium celatum]|uniref:histidine kinase n=1 Tax=Clostridium celatum DSM 1785 TaxID=545697 RepID=L1QLF7_9CLOT|nr:HAMP domain-containing sensor histidine kinase [Clostridium celatum]EKY28402.1 ATPase/histidine kinase/DNA gyrase B/HSP90 domain protein [Clostridium celatum DSM 1785]MCE9655162.1 HAMP domain-containing histidine kinase [Clostridium celatum]